MKTFVFISVLCISFSVTASFAQYRIKGIIKDSITKEALAFATVQLQIEKNGIYTDENGYFEISSKHRIDTLIVSYLSYQEKKIAVSQLSKIDENTIFLSNTATNLSEVIVTSKKSKEKNIMLGHYDFPTTFNWGSGPSYIFLNYYKNLTQASPIIKKLYFDFGKTLKITHKSLIRIRVMQRDSSAGKPTRDIIQDNMVVEVKPFSSKLIYDLEKYQIPFPKNGIFIGFEVIGIYRKHELITFNTGNTSVWVSSTEDKNRDKIGEAWTYSPFDRKWFTNYKRGHNRMFKFGMEIAD